MAAAGCRRLDLHAPANRIASCPVATRHLLIDEHDELAVGRVGGRNCPTPHDALAHRFEIAVGDDLPVAFCVRSRRRHVALDEQAIVADGGTKRQEPRRAGDTHAGEVASARNQLLIEQHDPFRGLVTRRWQRHSHRQHVRWIEAERYALQGPETPEHEAGAHEQHDGERHLDDDEPVAEALAASTARGALASVLERIGEVDPQGAQRRREAEEHARDECDQNREQQDPRIDRHPGHARNARRIPPGHDANRRVRESQPRDRADP
jgi:hypothetical protein